MIAQKEERKVKLSLTCRQRLDHVNSPQRPRVKQTAVPKRPQKNTQVHKALRDGWCCSTCQVLVQLKPSPTKPPQFPTADHLNLSTESTQVTWAHRRRCGQTHTPSDISDSDRLSTVKLPLSASPWEISSFLGASPSFSRPLCSLSFFSSSLSFTPGSFDHLRRRALYASLGCCGVFVYVCVCVLRLLLHWSSLNKSWRKFKKRMSFFSCSVCFCN